MAAMALTDTFVKAVKHTGAAAGDKHSDGLGLYLHVKAAGKYWRLNYRFLDKQKTLALGVYPAIGLADARRARDEARKQLAKGVDPSAAKREVCWSSFFGHRDKLFDCRLLLESIGWQVAQFGVQPHAVVKANDVVGDIGHGLGVVGVDLRRHTARSLFSRIKRRTR